MPQFSVYENINQSSKEAMPYLLDVQSDLLKHLSTRVVVPLCPVSALGRKSISTLSPEFDINGVSYTLLTPQLAGVELSDIGPLTADLSDHRFEIINALDFLFTGF